MANAIGFLVLLLLVALAAKFVPVGSGSIVLWAAVYLVLAAAAWHAWHDKNAPTDTLGWLVMAVGTVLLGATSFMIDVSLGHAKDPTLPLWAAAQEAGSIFGFAFTVTAFPGCFLISIAGMARTAYLSRRSGA